MSQELFLTKKKGEKGALNEFCKECKELENCMYEDPLDCFKYWTWLYGGF